MERKEDALLLLKCKEIYFSTDGACHKITENKTVLINELSSNQEEAGTKLCLYTQHALATNANGIVYARSHSGDADINVILISKILDNSERVILDFNKGRHRKVLQLADVEMTDDEKKALIGFLAFTSNDYTSAFFRKDKHLVGSYCGIMQSSFNALYTLEKTGSQVNSYFSLWSNLSAAFSDHVELKI